MKEELNDKTIIEALQRGNELQENQVFAFLFKKYKKPLQIYLSQCGLPSMDDAEEIFHDALLTLRAKARTKSFDFSQENAVRSYLYAVCRNQARKKWRSHYKDVDLVEQITVNDASEDSILEQLIQEDRGEFFKHLISTIGDKCRKILTRRFYLKHKHEDIAEDLGYASAQVSRNTTFNCIRKLRVKLEGFKDWESLLLP